MGGSPRSHLHSPGGSFGPLLALCRQDHLCQWGSEWAGFAESEVSGEPLRDTPEFRDTLS